MHDSTWKVLCVTGPERWNLLGGQDKTSQIKTNCCLIMTLKTCDSQGIYLATHTHTRPQEKLRLQGLGAEDVLKYKRNTLAVVAGLV